MKKILLPLLVIAIYALSCNKTPDPNPSRADMLRKGSWHLTGAKVVMKTPFGKDTTIDYYSMISPCYRDNYLKFDSLNHGAVHNGGTSCSAGDVDSVNFTWQLKNNDNIIELYGAYGIVDSVAELVYGYHIDTINANSTPIILDTLATAPGVVLDSILNKYFGVVVTSSGNIYNATISHFSQSSFTMSYSILSKYPHVDYYSQFTPVITVDTFHYSVTYTNQ